MNEVDDTKQINANYVPKVLAKHYSPAMNYFDNCKSIIHSRRCSIDKCSVYIYVNMKNLSPEKNNSNN